MPNGGGGFSPGTEGNKLVQHLTEAWEDLLSQTQFDSFQVLFPGTAFSSPPDVLGIRSQTSGKGQSGKDCCAAKASALSPCQLPRQRASVALGPGLGMTSTWDRSCSRMPLEKPWPPARPCPGTPTSLLPEEPTGLSFHSLKPGGPCQFFVRCPGEKRNRTKEERGRLLKRLCSASTDAQNAEWRSQLAARLVPALSHPELRLPQAQDHTGLLLLDRRAQTGLIQTWMCPTLWHAKKGLWIGERKSKPSLASPSAGDKGTPPIWCFQQHLGDSSCKLLSLEGHTAPSHKPQGEGLQSPDSAYPSRGSRCAG